MDISTAEHSDSDSGESWTLLENTPSYGHEAPDFPDNAAIASKRINVELHCEKDEDTDGISIISDSDHESASCEYVQSATEECPAEIENFQIETNSLIEQQNLEPLTSSLPANINHDNEPLMDETDFLGDKTKYRTYVHRRNPKVSNILDIIMLGTFIVTAGMALGHLWSCKNECTPQTSVNKILSNLYKLQEENAYLRNKLKELSLATGYQVQRKSDKPITKQQKCKKIFEEPIIKNKMDSGVKCVNEEIPVYNPSASAMLPQHDQELLDEIIRMKEIYNFNKNWIDEETNKQFDEFRKLNDFSPKIPDTKAEHKDNNLKSTQIPLTTSQAKIIQDNDGKPYKSLKSKATSEKQLNRLKREINSLKDNNLKLIDLKLVESDHRQKELEDVLNDIYEILPKKKITYADSLKADKLSPLGPMTVNNQKSSMSIKDHNKRKHNLNDDLSYLNAFSEEEIKKDDRYSGPKSKQKKKHDRQKSHKKQKRNNKYEQWEMKGGYLKDYDELSLASSQDNDKNLLINPERRFKDMDFENYIIKFLESDVNEHNLPDKDQSKVIDNKSVKMEKPIVKSDKPKKKGSNGLEWFNERSAMRAEMRRKLEHELFGDTPNNAAWYFRRMHKREQCRAQKDNSTFKKFSKRKMNFKMKR